MVITIIEEAIAAAMIGFMVERIIRKTLNYIYNRNMEDAVENLIIPFIPETTDGEVIITCTKDHSPKLYKFSKHI